MIWVQSYKIIHMLCAWNIKNVMPKYPQDTSLFLYIICKKETN